MRVLIVHNAVAPGASADDRDVLVQRDAIQAALSARGNECSVLDCTLDLEAARCKLLELRPDVVFNLVESLGGSDPLAALFPSLLEALAIPYTGNTAAALWLTNNKPAAKARLRQSGLPTPAWLGVRRTDLPSVEPGGTNRKSVLPACDPPLAGRFMIKAVWEHASFGLRDDAIVEVADADELRCRVEERAAQLGRACFAERFIEGREFNLSLLTAQGSRHTPCAVAAMPTASMPTAPGGTRSVPAACQVLPPAEIDFSAFPPGKPRIVGYEAKWDDASFEFHQTPRRFDFPPQDGPLLERLTELAGRCWMVFDLRGYVRVDFRVDRAGQPWILEINTNPCLSPDAGYAAALERAGISYEDALQRIVEEAAASRGTGVIEESAGSQPAVARWQSEDEHDAGPAAPCMQPAGHPPPPPRLRHEVLPSDPSAVRQIVESTGFFYEAECDVAVELVEERLAKGQASGYFFAFAEQGGRPIAYACYGPIACTVGSFDLFWIAVDQACQRQGLGRLLLEECERLIRAAGGRRVYIETSNRPQYVPTRAFYERCGYRCEAVLPEFYGTGDDKVIYAKAV